MISRYVLISNNDDDKGGDDHHQGFGLIGWLDHNKVLKPDE